MGTPVPIDCTVISNSDLFGKIGQLSGIPIPPPPKDLVSKFRWVQCTVKNETQFPVSLIDTYFGSGRDWTAPPSGFGSFSQVVFSSYNDDHTTAGVTGGTAFRLSLDNKHYLDISLGWTSPGTSAGSPQAGVVESSKAKDGCDAVHPGPKEWHITSKYVYEGKDKEGKPSKFQIIAMSTPNGVNDSAVWRGASGGFGTGPTSAAVNAGIALRPDMRPDRSLAPITRRIGCKVIRAFPPSNLFTDNDTLRYGYSSPEALEQAIWQFNSMHAWAFTTMAKALALIKYGANCLSCTERISFCFSFKPHPTRRSSETARDFRARTGRFPFALVSLERYDYSHLWEPDASADRKAFAEDLDKTRAEALADYTQRSLNAGYKPPDGILNLSFEFADPNSAKHYTHVPQWHPPPGHPPLNHPHVRAMLDDVTRLAAASLGSPFSFRRTALGEVCPGRYARLQGKKADTWVPLSDSWRAFQEGRTEHEGLEELQGLGIMSARPMELVKFLDMFEPQQILKPRGM